jgi:hypothetical protein
VTQVSWTTICGRARTRKNTKGNRGLRRVGADPVRADGLGWLADRSAKAATRTPTSTTRSPSCWWRPRSENRRCCGAPGRPARAAATCSHGWRDGGKGWPRAERETRLRGSQRIEEIETAEGRRRGGQLRRSLGRTGCRRSGRVGRRRLSAYASRRKAPSRARESPRPRANVRPR